MQHCIRIKPLIGRICNYSHMNYNGHIITYVTHYSNNVLNNNCFIGIFIVILLILLRNYILKYNGLSFHKGNMTYSTCHRWDSWSCSFKTTRTLIQIQVLISLTRTSNLNIVHNHFWIDLKWDLLTYYLMFSHNLENHLGKYSHNLSL